MALPGNEKSDGEKGERDEKEKMRRGLSWIVERGLGFGTVGVRKTKEVEMMRKGLSIIVGIAVLLLAYSASAGVATDGLVSWWKLDETNGTTAYDTEGSATNDGVLYNYGDNGTWTNDVPGSASYRALYFDASNSNYVDCGTNASLNITNAITIEAWVKAPGDVAQSILFQRQTGEDYSGSYGLQYDTVGGINFRVWDGASQTINSGVDTVGIEPEWIHICGIADGTNMKLYVNGSNEVASGLAGNLVGSSEHVYIGRRQMTSTHYDYYLDGTIDEVRIYNRALSLEEIQGNYEAIPEPSTLLFLGGGLLGLLAFKNLAGIPRL